MLADRFAEFYASMRDHAVKDGEPQAAQAAGTLVDEVCKAARFRLDEKAYALVGQALARPDAVLEACPHLSWPAATTWIECQMGKCPLGVLFFGGNGSDLQRGRLLVTFWTGTMPLMFHATCNLANGAEPFEWGDPKQVLAIARIWEQKNGTDPNDQMTEEQVMRFCTLQAHFVAGTLALLNSPKTARVEHVDPVKLNKARAKAKKPLLLSYRAVSIDLAKVERVLRERDAAEDGPGTPRQQHFVRWHLRLVRGVLYPVRPHWRGDPSLGVKAPPTYKLTAHEPTTSTSMP